MNIPPRRDGWICLHRQLARHPRFADPEWLSVWVFLLLSSTHKPRKVVFDGRPVTIQPGQLITSRDAIGRGTGVHPSKVFRLLKTLRAEQQIEQQTGAKSSIITVLNWRLYQQGEQQNEQQANNKFAKSEQQSDQQTNSTGQARKPAKTRQCSLSGNATEPQVNSNSNSKSSEIEHKQQCSSGTTRREPLRTADRIGIENQLAILKGRLQSLEGDTAEQWQRDARPELVEQKQNLRKQITELENRLLS